MNWSERKPASALRMRWFGRRGPVVTGFGYDNVEVLGVSGQRSHVERRINDAEAAVVRRIFRAVGCGPGRAVDYEAAERRG